MALPRKFKPRDLTISSELKTLYGRPVVTSENRAAYDRMLLGLIECLDPKDCMERSLVKDITDAIVKNLGAPPEAVTVSLVETPKTDKSKGGVLFSDMPARS